jgi:hypothetical protein
MMIFIIPGIALDAVKRFVRHIRARFEHDISSFVTDLGYEGKRHVHV